MGWEQIARDEGVVLNANGVQMLSRNWMSFRAYPTETRVELRMLGQASLFFSQTTCLCGMR